MINRAIKYRLYPTEDQKVFFAKTFGCVRKVYNLMLSDKIKSYQDTGEFCKATPAMYKRYYPYLKEVDSLALANASMNLQAAFSNFFSRTRKKKNGFPKFKSFKRSKRSYTTNNQRGSVAVLKDSIKLPKIKIVKAEIHRVPEENWVLKSATISQDRDGKYYASVLFAFEEEKPTYKIDTEKLPTIPLVHVQVDTKNVADVRDLNELDTALQEYASQDLKAYWRKTRTTAAIQPNPQSSTQSIKRNQTTKQIRHTVAYEKVKPNHHYTIISTLYISVEENGQQKSYALNEETHPFNPSTPAGELTIEHPYDKALLDKWRKEHPTVKFPENISYTMSYKLRE
mgnify:CR=1 FL=1